MLIKKLCIANPILTHAYEVRGGEMVFLHNGNFEIEDLVESTFEDWKLPPSIEDEEAMPGAKSRDIILEEAKRAQGELAP
jgi:hypothetical protein